MAGAAFGCGGEDEPDLVEEGELRECLANAGFALEPPPIGAGAALGSASADFRARTPGGVAVDVVVLGSERKAERAAADIAAARATLGGGGELVAERNAIAVFESEPDGESLGALEDCLGG
jgi:hypothetical protein